MTVAELQRMLAKLPGGMDVILATDPPTNVYHLDPSLMFIAEPDDPETKLAGLFLCAMDKWQVAFWLGEKPYSKGHQGLVNHHPISGRRMVEVKPQRRKTKKRQ